MKSVQRTGSTLLNFSCKKNLEVTRAKLIVERGLRPILVEDGTVILFTASAFGGHSTEG